MSPQHSSSAPAVSRCRDALQVIVCTIYKQVHLKAYIKCSSSRHIVPNGRLLSWCVSPSYIGDRSTEASLIFSTPHEPRYCVTVRSLARCSSAPQRQFSPIDKYIKFNRMNGSPGDPPANRMHISKHKRITPVNHRLASDPIGKEASWEATT
jgi:hypothetical protein